MHKKLLFISRHAPYGTNSAKDAIDAALAASIFDQDIGFLFIDDGVFQLLRNQQSQCIEQKNIASILSAFSLYGIDKIYAHKESLIDRGLTIEELHLAEVVILNNNDVAFLLSQQDQLLSF
jgi:tRNA 2-thiouridine synthesizing protein C